MDGVRKVAEAGGREANQLAHVSARQELIRILGRTYDPSADSDDLCARAVACATGASIFVLLGPAVQDGFPWDQLGAFAGAVARDERTSYFANIVRVVFSPLAQMPGAQVALHKKAPSARTRKPSRRLLNRRVVIRAIAAALGKNWQRSPSDICRSIGSSLGLAWKNMQHSLFQSGGDGGYSADIVHRIAEKLAGDPSTLPLATYSVVFGAAYRPGPEALDLTQLLSLVINVDEAVMKASGCVWIVRFANGKAHELGFGRLSRFGSGEDELSFVGTLMAVPQVPARRIAKRRLAEIGRRTPNGLVSVSAMGDEPLVVGAVRCSIEKVPTEHGSELRFAVQMAS